MNSGPPVLGTLGTLKTDRSIMTYLRILIALILLHSPGSLPGQDLKDCDIYLGDTLISKPDFIRNGKGLDSTRLKNVSFKPVTDGQKTIYYLNGRMYGQGEIKNKKENGLWTYWHDNGKKAREGHFAEGKRVGTHTYWYANGNVRGIGNFTDDKYDGKWTMYKEDGSEVVEQFYKNGELVKKK